VERLAEACRQAGREPEDVALVGACKRQPLERIAAALDAGLRILGENQVQEGETHRAALVDAGYGDRVAWHLIGPLQSNKAARACDVFDVFEAVDRPKIAERLDRVLGSRGLGARGCLLEVNIGSEPSKHGFLPEDTEAMLRIGELDHLRVRGLMAIPPQRSGARESRADFAALRRLRDRLAQGGLFGDRKGWLSMGMSADFETAIRFGATHVRVGSAVFGARG
jgi:pyridoxal phosphate enzyme (YggS family)